MSHETLLRETLRSYAVRAPGSPGLLDAVRDRSERRRRNRYLVAAGVATVSVAIVAGLVVRAPGADEPITPAEPSVLVPPAYELPAFPFTPGWAPDGAAEPYATFDGPVTTLVHPHQDGGDPLVTVDVEQPGSFLLPERYGILGGPDPETIRGHPASFFSRSGGPVGVSWRDDTGRMIVVSTDRLRSLVDLVRYAEALIERPLPVRSPFTFELVPPGAEPVEVSRNEFSFTLAGGPAAMPRGTLRVWLVDAGRAQRWNMSFVGANQHQRQAVRVAGHDALLMEGFTGRTVHVFLSEDLVLHVAEPDGSQPGTPVLSRDDLLRFAAGVHVTPYAVPAH